MPIQKQPLNINFAQGLDQKSDPKQVQPGKFVSLTNSVFNKVGLLEKRNGFTKLADVSGATAITTYKDGLLAIGDSVQSYSTSSGVMTGSGFIKCVSVDVMPLNRKNYCSTVDVAISNGLSCSTWRDGTSGSSYYQVSDLSTGQVIVQPTLLPNSGGLSRVFSIGRFFFVTFVTSVPSLQFIAVPIANPAGAGSAANISTQITVGGAYDGCVANDTLYVSWNGSDGGGAIRTAYVTSTLSVSAAVTIAGESADLISVSADQTNSSPVIWVSFYNASGNTIKSAAYNNILAVVLAKTTVVSSITINELTSVAYGNINYIWHEVAGTYSYTPNAKTDLLDLARITIGGTVTVPGVYLRGVGLASKPVYVSSTGKAFFLVCYGGTYQPSYFLVDSDGKIISSLAYSNGYGYLYNQILPSMNLDGSTLRVGYLFKEQLAAVNKSEGVANVAGIYSQTGINLVTFNLDTVPNSSEIGNNLHLTGGFLWMFDGSSPVEHGFFLYPEDMTGPITTSGGSMTDQQYYYKACYEWTDNQGNIHRSAPSAPLSVLMSGSSNAGKVTLNIPTLRLTYKTNVRIVLYRWSAAQQTYYRITSITSPLMSVKTSDAVSYVDSVSDSSIVGNDIIYTTGGVLENIPAPSCSATALFKSRLFLIDSEDKNLIWYSKPVLEATPVEMTDLQTLYVAPTTGAQGSTGPITALSAMDDKLIIFKKDAVYYLVGSGPDATGANNDFSDPVFITATVGCVNQKSIVFMPDGLMFQSDKGIWLLSRNLQTTYIGSPVENFNNKLVTSAVTVPGTNQVRMTLNDRVTLMYDYFFGQWGSFSNLPAVSSCTFQGMHSYLNSSGQLLQEASGSYVDVSSPVLMSFKTGWINVAGLQGFERIYYMYLLAKYLSPHRVQVQIAYDYNDAPTQSTVIAPTNYSGFYGSDTLYGGSEFYGGQTDKEQWRIFFERQKCQAFQLTITEIFDSSYGTAPGAGFQMSGLDLLIGIKDGKPRTGISSSQSAD